MGQKINPINFRLFLTKRWDDKLFIEKFNYSSIFYQNLQLWKYINGFLNKFKCILSSCIIKRVKDKVFVIVYFYNNNKFNNSSNLFRLNLNKDNWFWNNIFINKFFSFWIKKKIRKFNRKVTNRNTKFNEGFSLILFLEKIAVYFVWTSNVKVILRPIYFFNWKKNKRFFLLNKKLGFKPWKLNSLEYLFLFDKAFSLKSAKLLSIFLSKQLPFFIRNVKVFIRFIEKLLLIFYNLYGYKGVWISIKGRLNGARRARTFSIQKGRMPLGSLDSPLLYHYSESLTVYGVCSVKVWFYF